MRLIHRKALALITTALSAYASQPAFAQAAGEAPGDIIVTARRTEERLQDVPLSLTVYTQEALSNRNIFNAADLGVYTPSLSANSQYGCQSASNWDPLSARKKDPLGVAWIG